LVGSGRLKLNAEDVRNDTPQEIKDLIISCSQYDREKRVDFIQVNFSFFKYFFSVTLLGKNES
jgi:hypothetical protein